MWAVVAVFIMVVMMVEPSHSGITNGSGGGGYDDGSHSGGIDEESRIIKVIGVNIYDRMK